MNLENFNFDMPVQPFLDEEAEQLESQKFSGCTCCGCKITIVQGPETDKKITQLNDRVI